MSMRIATLTALGLVLGLGGASVANASSITMNLYSSFNDSGKDITPTGSAFETASVSAIDFQSHGSVSYEPTLWPTPDKVFAAIFTAKITTTGLLQTFSLTSDDASYLFIDGKSVGSLPGTHPVESAPFLTSLSAGTHTLRLAYDNLQPTDAVIKLGLSSNVNYVPLPASLPMFGVALIGLGAVGYGVKRGKRTSAA